ncbi:MAG: sigma-70 family RNA polymerase sigma factor [Deltaproteobacteria bacterium]|nr:sigma-70 family RNA polymerase sigma factor [Deltaproteobacteria bacterium]
MSPRERRLIRRLKQRDERAFREMVLTYQQQVYSIVLRMLGNEQEAEDLAQEVFVTVFKSIENFRGDSKLGTWIYRIAINHCRNRFKYLSRRHYHTTKPLDDVREREQRQEIPLHGQMGRPDEVLEGRRLQQAIQAAIAALESDHREVLVLRDIQGVSYEEIGSITGLPPGTVKSRLHRARMALKEQLEKHMK